MIKFNLKDNEFIPLCNLLKLTNLCESGGSAKSLIEDGEVEVDGKVEYRKRYKVRKGQTVKFNGQTIIIID